MDFGACVPLLIFEDEPGREFRLPVCPRDVIILSQTIAAFFGRDGSVHDVRCLGSHETGFECRGIRGLDGNFPYGFQAGFVSA